MVRYKTGKVAVVATVWFWWGGDPDSVFMGTRGKWSLSEWNGVWLTRLENYLYVIELHRRRCWFVGVGQVVLRVGSW
jgi:hypothetical protein